jgi:biopolymer transport protein TolQ
LGDTLLASHAALAAFILQTGILEMVSHGTVFTYAVLAILACFSILSLTIAFAKWSAFSGAATSDSRFVRAFRRANSIETVAAAAESFRPAPLVKVFDGGYAEASRQLQAYQRLTNKEAISRSLQIAVSEQLSRFEHNLNWLATIATVSPFIGLFGTVMGIIRVFSNLGASGSTSMTTVGPGVSEALITTGVGLVAAIPAAIFYNIFGRRLKEMGDRFDNFSLEFINMVERSSGE